MHLSCLDSSCGCLLIDLESTLTPAWLDTADSELSLSLLRQPRYGPALWVLFCKNGPLAGLILGRWWDAGAGDGKGGPLIILWQPREMRV